MGEAIESRKEFEQLRTQEASCERGERFILTSPQLYLVRYVDAVDKKVVIAAYGTGTGKTPGSLMSALAHLGEFKKDFAKIRRDIQRAERDKGQRVSRAALHDAAAETPSVFVLGFSEVVFRRELASRPAFGVATPEEVLEVRRLRTLAESSRGEAARRQLRNLLAGMKRRMVDKLRGGFWKFIGYQELANRMFPDAKVRLHDLIRIADTQGRPLSEVVAAAEKKGALKVNRKFLRKFRDGFLICDEVHHTYNSKMPNNWGGCLRLILELGKISKAVLLTATPARGLATEFVDLANLVRAGEGKPPRNPADFFEVKGVGARRWSVTSRSALADLKNEFRGHLLFYQSAAEDPKLFPRWDYEGVLLPGMSPQASAGVRFQISKCSAEQTRRYIEVLSSGLSPASAEAGAIRDAAFPCPGGTAVNSKDFEKIARAPVAWRKKHQIGYDLKRGAVTGPAVRDPKRLAQYSAALADMRGHVLEHLKARRGKLMIFHPRVRGMGVETIANIIEGLGVSVLRDSGRVEPATDGWCLEHGPKCKKKGCSFAQATVLHSYLDQGSLERVLSSWNSDDNVRGEVLTILIASEVLEEMHTLLATPTQYILGVPQNIASLRQLNGRIVRLNVMRQLPEDERVVTFKIFAQSMQVNGPASAYGREGWNIEAWRVMLKEYQTIRACERAVYSDAPGAAQLRSAQGLREDRLGPPPFPTALPKPARRVFSEYDSRGYGEESAARYADAIRELMKGEGALSYRSLKEIFLKKTRGCLTASEYGPISGSKLDEGEFNRALLAVRDDPARTKHEISPGRVIVMKGDLVFATDIIDDRPVIDYDLPSMIVSSKADSHADSPVDVLGYVRDVKSFYNFQVQRDSWFETLPQTSPEIAATYDKFNEEFHYRMLRELLSAGSLRRGSPPARAAAAYADYGFVLSKSALAPHSARAGFRRRGGAEVLTKSGWRQIGYRTPAAKEQPLAGSYETQADRIQFKLRKPSGGKSAGVKSDRRLLERGVACTSKRKDELARLVVEFGGETRGASSGELCERLKLAMLRRQHKDPRGHFIMFFE